MMMLAPGFQIFVRYLVNKVVNNLKYEQGTGLLIAKTQLLSGSRGVFGTWWLPPRTQGGGGNRVATSNFDVQNQQA